MNLGDLSAKYESNGDPGAVGDTPGDAGGTSYGAYQFASNAGVPQAFVSWLAAEGYSHAGILAEAGEPGTAEFTTAWQRVAEIDPEGFLHMQRRYVQQNYYEPAAMNLITIGFDVNERSEAIRQVVWSAAVQYGPRWMNELFQTAATFAAPNTVDDAALIKAIYDVRASDDWTSGSPDLRSSLRERFANECCDALAMLG